MIELSRNAAEAAEAVRLVAGPEPPSVAIVLGSGLGGLADSITEGASIPFDAIPHLAAPTVAGHRGEVVVGMLGGVRVVAVRGRLHSYEGHDLAAVTFPIRLVRALGAEKLILTAAAGGVRESFRTGDLVVLSDHLNLLGMNPLRGPNEESLGPRFPDMTAVYDLGLRAIAREVADGLGMVLSEGVYAAVPGPSYETPAEVRMLRTLGADVVGMSTVPEAIVARHAGMAVLGIALVTNPGAGITGEPLSHDEVLEAGRRAAQGLGELIRGVIVRMKTIEE